MFFISCLPQEKTASCKTGETFSQTKRRCVANLTVNQAKISNVTPSSSYTISPIDSSRTHTVTVSDPTGDGFAIKWIVVDPNGNTTELGTGLSLTFNHTSFTPGAYTVEVQVLTVGGTQVTDSRSWSVNIIGEQTPTITQVTSTPFSTTITSSPIAIQANISNPDLISSINYEWLVNGNVTLDTGVFSTSTRNEVFSFDPSSSSSYFTGSNIYTVQLVLKENGTGAIYTSASWTINNTIPGFANPALADMTLFPGNNTPSSGSFITAIDKVDTPSGGFLFDVDNNGSLDNVDFCVEIKNTTSGDDFEGINGDGVFVDFLSNNTVIASQEFTSEETPVCLGVLNSVFFQSLPANIVAESQSISAVIYDKYTGQSGLSKYNGFNEITRFNWTTRVRQKNTPPRLSIRDTNPSDVANNENTNIIFCASETETTYSTCTVTQGARTNPGLVLIPFDLGLNLDDDDYDSTTDFSKFRVEYFLNGVLLDGNHPLSSSDCFLDFGQITSINDYTCSLSLNPYDSNGPIDPSGLNYTITAKVTDLDSPFIVQTSESNTLTWRISTINDFNSDISVNNFADAPVPANTASFIRLGASTVNIDNSIGAPDALSELDNIVFHVSVDDLERDSFNVRINRCSDGTCTTTTQVVTATYNSNNENNPKIVPIAHTISQDAVVGTDQASVTYQIIVEDIPGGALTATSDSTTVSVIVNNKNEDPVFDPNQFEPPLPLASPLIAFTGFPMTFDPGVITDQTLSDGKNIKYQWLVSADLNQDGDFTNDLINGKTGFRAIPGATSKVLIWSPGQEIDFSNQEGTPVQIKLCLGDDGLVDGTTNSKNPEGQDACTLAGFDSIDTSNPADGGISPYNITVFSNMVKGRSHTNGAGNNSFNNNDHPNGELAVWIDPRSADPLIKYLVYVNRSREIVVEKIVTASNGEKSGSAQTSTTTDIEFISFPHSTDANFANNIVSNLSIIGDTTNDFLYISYMAPIGVKDNVHIRRINIGGGKTGFSHDGKLGFDKSYNGLLSAPSPLISDNSGNINLTQNASTNGLVQIEFSAAATLGETVSFNGFTLGSLASLTAGTDYCGSGSAISGCGTSAETAASFSQAVNDSTNPELQGITASNIAGTNIVTLEGMAEGEFLELDLGAQDLGSIYINENLNKWVLPYINGSLSAPNKNKVSLLNGDLNARLVNANTNSNHLTATSASDEIANDTDANDRILIATKTEISGEISLTELDDFHNIVDGSADLFNDQNITNIKITISKENTDFNPSAFITGTNANNRLAFARIDSSAGDFNFASAIVRADLDPDFTLIEGLKNYDITAGAKANQLLLGAIVDSNLSGLSEEAFIFQITGATSPIIDCSFDSLDPQNSDKCMRLSPRSSTRAFDLAVAFGDVIKDVTLGTDGATTNESTQDIVPFVYHVDDGGGSINDDALPIVGIINASSTSLTTNEDANLGATSIIPYIR